MGTNNPDSLANNANIPRPTKPASWKLVIEPGMKWYDLRLGELWNYRDLIILFVRRDFVSRFKQTVLGPLWFFIQPFLTTVTFTVIFGNIAKLPTDGLPQFLFYMSGTVLWTYFSNCLITISETFINYAHIFGKVYFPRLVIPISIVIDNFLSFILQLLFFFAFLSYFLLRGSAVHLTSWAFCLPLLLILNAGFGLGFGIIVSSLTVKYRDLRYLVSFGISLWMYATPVIVPASAMQGKFRWIADVNPITPTIETFRAGFLGVGDVSWIRLGYSFLLMVIVIFVGLVIFHRVERTFIDTV